MSFSKSKYIRGLQCPKMIWMDKNMPEVAEQGLESDYSRTENNHVKSVARGYFGDYYLVENKKDKGLMVKDTLQQIDKGAMTICDATFVWEDNLCVIDILRVYPDGVEIVAVHNAASVHEIYYDDASYQMYVVSGLGLKVKKVFNLIIDNSYVRQGELELKKLFKLVDCTDSCIIKQKEVAENIEEFKKALSASSVPDIDLSEGCFKPYSCIYWKHCSKNLPNPNVFDICSLNAESKVELYKKGLVDYKQLLEEDVELTARQRLQVSCHLSEEGVFEDKKKIKSFLDTLTYPLYFLDFESCQFAIPPFDGLSPYMQVPFQYSLHVMRTKGGALEHYEFLGKEGTDTRQALANQLIKDIPYDVCVMAYGASFEKSVIAKLAEQFPKLQKHLMNIHSNIVDLMQPFEKQGYYCKEMNGSYSIKQVLPALCPGDPSLDYHNLVGIHDGEEAKNAFASLAGRSLEEVAEVRRNLLSYCCLDTLAMVKILEKLY